MFLGYDILNYPVFDNRNGQNNIPLDYKISFQASKFNQYAYLKEHSGKVYAYPHIDRVHHHFLCTITSPVPSLEGVSPPTRRSPNFFQVQVHWSMQLK